MKDFLFGAFRDPIPFDRRQRSVSERVHMRQHVPSLWPTSVPLPSPPSCHPIPPSQWPSPSGIQSSSPSSSSQSSMVSLSPSLFSPDAHRCYQACTLSCSWIVLGSFITSGGERREGTTASLRSPSPSSSL